MSSGGSYSVLSTPSPSGSYSVRSRPSTPGSKSRESPRERRERKLANKTMSTKDLMRMAEANTEQFRPPWIDIAFAVLFILSLWIFQDQHFDIVVQRDVHAGLRDNLDLHVDNDDDFHRVRSRSDTFSWLAGKLLPALSNPGAAFTPGVSTATRNRTQCLAVLGDTERALECDFCDSSAPPISDSNLETYIDEYTVLFGGLWVRQTLHCELTGIDEHGELHLLQNETMTQMHGLCQHSSKANRIFAEAAQDLDFAAPMSHHEQIPPPGCYDFDVEKRAAKRLLASPDERQWLDKSILTRRQIFIPVRAGQPAALSAGQALLNATGNSEWADPATAVIEASFMTASIEYGMLSEVLLTFRFNLGGSVTTHHTIRSVPGAILNTREFWRKWEPMSDTLFVFVMIARWFLELRVMHGAYMFGAKYRRGAGRTSAQGEMKEKRRRVASQNYTSLFPRWIFGLCQTTNCTNGGDKLTRGWSLISSNPLDTHMDIFNGVMKSRSQHNRKTGTVDRDGLKEVMKRLQVSMSDSDLVTAMEEYCGRPAGVHGLGLNRREFNKFYSDYTKNFTKVYSTDMWKLVLTLPLLCFHSYACVLLYQLHNVSSEFIELAHSSEDARWSFTRDDWQRGPGPALDNDVIIQHSQAMDEMHHIVGVVHELRWICGVMLILQAAMCQRYCIHIDHKLAIVAESIRGAFDELKPFFAVFIFMLCMYATAGYFMYGAELPEFSTVLSSTQECFALMLAGGNFRRMGEITWWGTFIFYWSWVSLSFVILMNIVISILTESHIEATRVIDAMVARKSDSDDMLDQSDTEDDSIQLEDVEEQEDPPDLHDRMTTLENSMDQMLRMLADVHKDQQQLLLALQPAASTGADASIDAS